MINWTKLLQTKLTSKEDAPEALDNLISAIPDNMLLSMLQTAVKNQDYKVAASLKKEKDKRGI